MKESKLFPDAHERPETPQGHTFNSSNKPVSMHMAPANRGCTLKRVSGRHSKGMEPLMRAAFSTNQYSETGAQIAESTSAGKFHVGVIYMELTTTKSFVCE